LKIYGIGGLGADQRVYNFMTLTSEFIFIDWIPPIKNESIKDYAKRLSKGIDTKSDFCLIGVSFGGLIATEISQILDPKLTILISSVQTKYELRSLYTLFGKTKLIHLIPTFLFDPPRRIATYLFGARNSALLHQIFDDTDLSFVKWAVTELINWKNTTELKNVLKINGTHDKLIPARGTTTAMKMIDKGEHFMIVDRGEEISKVINNMINNIR